MSNSTILLALVFGNVQAAIEAVMSHPSLVLAVMCGFVLLFFLLLEEKPHVQPAEEAHEFTPRGNGKIASAEDLPSIPSAAGEREKVGEDSPAPGTAPAELPAPTNGAEALLMPLASQFLQMQQQMFEQFQQSLMMIVELFGNMQREQLALIRQLLEQIRELTRQLHALQSEGMRQLSSPLLASGEAAAPIAPTPSLNSLPPLSTVEAGTPSAKLCDADVHVWLSQRLSALQQER